MATQSNNFILIEKDASSPIRGQQRSIDAADDIVLAPATVSIAPSGNVAINSVSGTLSMGNVVSTQAINIGTNGARIITIGQGTATGPTLVLNGTTGSVILDAVGTLSIGSAYVGTETVNLASAANGALGQIRTLNIGSTNTSSATNLYSGTGGTNIFGLFQVSASSSAISIASTTGAINIDGTTTGTIGLGTAGGTGAINIGTAGTNRTITLGNATNTSGFFIHTGTGGIILSTNATAGGISIGVDNGTGTIAIGNGTGNRAINIGIGANDGAVNIATSASAGRAVTLGNSTGTTSLTLQSGTGALNIGTAATNKIITIGQTANTSNLALNGGTGGIQLSTGATTGAISLTNTSTGAINIGNDTGTGNISIAGPSATTVRYIVIGTGSTGQKTVDIGSNAVAGNSVNLFGGSTGGINIATAAVAVPVNIATGSTAGTVSIGTGSAAHTLAFGTGLGNKTVQVGSTSGTSATTIQAATGGISLSTSNTSGAIVLSNSGSGNIQLGNDAGTGNIDIASGASATSTRSVNIGTGSSGIKTISIGSTTASGLTAIASPRLRIGALSSNPVEVGCVVRNGAGTTLFAGEIVTIQSTSTTSAPTVIYANAATAGAKGFAGVCPTNQTIANLSFGQVASVPGTITFIGLTAAPSAGDSGKPVYLSTTDGKGTLTAPSGSGQRVFIIGYLTSTTAVGLLYPVQLMPQFIADIP